MSMPNAGLYAPQITHFLLRYCLPLRQRSPQNITQVEFLVTKLNNTNLAIIIIITPITIMVSVLLGDVKTFSLLSAKGTQ